MEKLKELTTNGDAGQSKKLLKTFNCLYGRRQTIDALLQQATRAVVELLQVKCCMIAWLTEDKKAMEARSASYWNSHNGSEENIETNGYRSVNIPEVWQSLQELSNFDEASVREEVPAKKLMAAIRVNGEIVGNIYIPASKGYDDDGSAIDTELFSTICAHVGFAVEMLQMRQMLTLQYATEPSTLDAHILAAVKDPEHATEVIARSFYKHLRKAGFETKQILVVASEIIENLNQALFKTQAKRSDAKKIV